MNRVVTILLATVSLSSAVVSLAQAPPQQSAPVPPVPSGVSSANPAAQPPPEAQRPAPATPAPAAKPRVSPGSMPATHPGTVSPSFSKTLEMPVMPPVGPTGAATTLTLQEALSRALQVNNSVERARADIAYAEGNRKYLLSQVLPRINLTGSTIHNSKEVTFGQNDDATTILPRNDWNYRVVLSQPIYAGNRERRAYEQAKLGVASAGVSELGTEDSILLRVASNYLAVANADARMDIERRNIELAQKRRTQAAAFYEAGEGTRVDTLRAETSIKSAQRALAGVVRDRETAVGQLRADLDLDTPIAVASSGRAFPELPDEASLIRKAEDSRPDVRLAQNNLQVARLEVRKQRGFWLPTVTFDGGFIAQKSGFPASNYSYGAFRFTVPLLQSGEVESRMAQARAHELSTQLQLEDARSAAREDVRKSLVDLHEAETSLGLANEQLTAAQAEYDQTFELYRAEESTSLDLVTSEASLADARRAVAEETLNRDLAEMRVWYAAGDIKRAVGAPQSAIVSPSASEPSADGNTSISIEPTTAANGVNQ